MNLAAKHHSIPTFLKKHLATLGIGATTGMFIHMVARGDSALLYFYPSQVQFFIAALVSVLLAFIIVANNNWLNKVAPWRKGSGKRLLLGLISNFLFVLVIYRIANFILLIKFPEDELSAYSNKFLLLSFIAILIYSVIYFALSSYHIYTEEKLSSIKVRREQVDLQYQALKSQLSPHFLFNGLNTISALIYDKPNIGKKFIRSFADCYKFVLSNYKEDLITVKDELAFVEAYIYLLKTRHQNNLTLSIKLSDESYRSYLPPLAIQMLVENAAKHNQITKDQKLEIHIEDQRGQIIVRNNTTEKPTKVSSLNVGLKNILKRYKLLGLSDVQVIDGNDFEVRLPQVLKR